MRSLLLLALFAAACHAQPQDILPDESLKGWTRIPIPPADGLKPQLQWRVDAAEHALVCAGDGGHEWLRYDRPLGDFIFQVDWRYTPRGPDERRYNSGIGVRLSRYGELWVQAQAGLTGYLFGANFAGGAIKSFNLSKEAQSNPVKPAGEWNHYEIRVQGDRVALFINGEAVNEFSGIGLRTGYIGLEAEGYEITFKNLRLQPIN